MLRDGGYYYSIFVLGELRVRLELGVRDWMKIISLHAEVCHKWTFDSRCSAARRQKESPSSVHRMHCASDQAMARSNAQTPQRLDGRDREALLVTGICLGGSRPYTKTRFLRPFIKLCERRATDRPRRVSSRGNAQKRQHENVNFTQQAPPRLFVFCGEEGVCCSRRF